jgi:hypothetical protein
MSATGLSTFDEKSRAVVQSVAQRIDARGVRALWPSAGERE